MVDSSQPILYTIKERKLTKLPKELQRAEKICDNLAHALQTTRKFKLNKVSVDIPIIEELIDLLSDSLRTAKTIPDLKEHDGTVEKIFKQDYGTPGVGKTSIKKINHVE